MENLLEAINDIARERGIERNRLVTVVQESIVAAAKRKFKQYEDVEARITEGGGIEVYRYKTVAEVCEDADNQISLEDARELDTMAEVGDEVEYEIDNSDLRRVLAQTARQMLFQRLREAERDVIFEKFKGRIGDVLSGTVSRTERGKVYVTFHQTESVLHPKEQIPNERWASGDHIRMILLDVLNDPKEPSQLIVSRAHPNFLVKLFEMEAPEIYDGVVEIVAAAREPGRRAKIAVRSNDADVDPVGACVGMRGARVQAIISELRGERIDIVQYSEDITAYLANAIAPAEISRVKINREEGVIDVEVEPEQLALAIGRHGQNVRLASRLLDYQLNVRSTTDQTKTLEEQIRERLQATLSAQGGHPVAPDAVIGGDAQTAEDAIKGGAVQSEHTVPPDAVIGGDAQTAEDAIKGGAVQSEHTVPPDAVIGGDAQTAEDAIKGGAVQSEHTVPPDAVIGGDAQTAENVAKTQAPVAVSAKTQPISSQNTGAPSPVVLDDEMAQGEKE